jgi:hypothetical protein
VQVVAIGAYADYYVEAAAMYVLHSMYKAHRAPHPPAPAWSKKSSTKSKLHTVHSTLHMGADACVIEDPLSHYGFGRSKIRDGMRECKICMYLLSNNSLTYTYISSSLV